MNARIPLTIVGGGIGGLALAAALPSERFEVTLLEQRVGLPRAGTSIALWPEAQRVLAGLGVLDGLLAVSPRIRRFPIGRAVDGAPWVSSETSESPIAGRHDLLAALDGAVPGAVRRVAVRVDGPSALAVQAPAGTLVVGADGVHSVVRRAGWGERAAAVATPYLAVRGVVDLELEDAELGEYWGRGRLYGLGPHRDGINWYTAFRSQLGPRDVDVDAALAEARAGGPVAPAIARVLAAADPATTLAQRIWTTPRLDSFVRGRSVLLGDAAHAMTPNLGRGACEALVDAATLAGLLREHPVEVALVEYDRRRRARTLRLQRASAVLMRVGLAEGAQPLRDGVLGAMGRLTRRREARTTSAGFVRAGG